MTFEVKYRNKQGAVEYTRVDAASRSEVFTVLKDRGITSVIQVLDATGKKPHKVASSGAPISGTIKGLMALVAVCVIGAGVFMFVSKDEPKAKPVEEKKPTKEKRIEVVTPEILPKAVEKPVEEKKVDEAELVRERNKAKGYPQNPWGTPIPKDLEYKPHWEYTAEDYARIDPGYKERHERFLEEQAKIPWSHPCECEIARLIFTRPGDPVLDMPISKGFVDQFLKSIETPIIVSKDDSPEVAEQKKEMIEVKKYLKEQLDEGRDIVSILEDTKKALADLNGLRDALTQELREIEKSAQSEQEIDDYVAAANQMLAEKGGGEIRLPLSAARLRLRRAARANANQ